MDSPQERVRVVYDCMIFLQGAARRESPAGLCLLLAERGIVELCISREILSEVADVLTRTRIRTKFPALTEEVVADFLATLRGISTFFEDVPRELVLPRDPKDEPYLNLACGAEAHYLVSRDADLLDLAVAHGSLGTELREKHPHLVILDPSSFISAIKARMVGS
jgi:putative PIN family toxin of toxin-antitoxin system